MTSSESIHGKARILHLYWHLSKMQQRQLLCPVGDENIRLVWGGAVAIRRPYEELAVGGEHGERVEPGIGGDAFEACAVFANDVKIKAGGVFRVAHVRGENDALAVWQEV